MADINQDLILKCSKLQSEIEKLKEENSRIRQDCYHEAMEQFRPIVTSQYAELIKMAAKFNMYQYNINKTLQKSIQNVRIGFIGFHWLHCNIVARLRQGTLQGSGIGLAVSHVFFDFNVAVLKMMNPKKGNSFQSNILPRNEFDKTESDRSR